MRPTAYKWLFLLSLLLVAGGLIGRSYLLQEDTRLVAYDTTGVQRWSHTIRADWQRSASDSGRIVIESEQQQTHHMSLTAYAVADGDSLWQWSLTPAVANTLSSNWDTKFTLMGAVALVSIVQDDGPDWLWALEAATGAELWHRKVDWEPSTYLSDATLTDSAVMIVRGSTAANGGPAVVEAYARSNGTPIWSRPLEDGSRSQYLVYHAQTVYVQTTNLVALDAATGALQWERPLAAASVALRWFDQALVSVDASAIYGLNPATGAIQWQIPVPSERERFLDVRVTASMLVANVIDSAQKSQFIGFVPPQAESTWQTAPSDKITLFHGTSSSDWFVLEQPLDGSFAIGNASGVQRTTVINPMLKLNSVAVDGSFYYTIVGGTRWAHWRNRS